MSLADLIFHGARAPYYLVIGVALFVAGLIVHRLRVAHEQHRLFNEIEELERKLNRHTERLAPVVPHALDFALSLGVEGTAALRQAQLIAISGRELIDEVWARIGRGDRRSLREAALLVSDNKEIRSRMECCSHGVSFNDDDWERELERQVDIVMSRVKLAVSDAQEAGVPMGVVARHGSAGRARQETPRPRLIRLFAV